MPNPNDETIPIDDSKKKYVINTVAELIETHDKLAKSYKETMKLLKQLQERLEKE